MNAVTLVITAWILSAHPSLEGNGLLIFMLLIALPMIALSVALGSAESARKARQLSDRTAALRGVADSLKWKFDEEDFSNGGNRLAGFHIGAIGGSQSVRNVISGNSDGIGVTVFDFSYVIKGKHAVTVTQTVVELQCLGDKRPSFFLRPERAWWNRPLLEAYCDHDFESHPEFSQRYQLSARNETAIRELFTPNVLEFFERQERIFVEGAAQQLIYYREGIEVEADKVGLFVNEAVECGRLLLIPAK